MQREGTILREEERESGWENERSCMEEEKEWGKREYREEGIESRLKRRKKN